MFNLKAILSSRIVPNEDLAKILGSTFPSGAISQSIAGVLDHMGKLLGGMAITNGAAAEVAKQLAGGNGAKPNLDSIGPALTKVAYIAVLAEAIEDAKQKQHFNVETAVNDLWVKLSRVRPQQNASLKNGLSDLMSEISRITGQQSTMIKSVMQNMR